jgi:hypothetical protein
MKIKYCCFLLILVLVLGYAAFSRHSVKASGSVKVYRVETNVVGQMFVPLESSSPVARHDIETSDVVGFSCTSGKDRDTCYVLAK